jgi:hypothetical protein
VTQRRNIQVCKFDITGNTLCNQGVARGKPLDVGRVPNRRYRRTENE